MIEETRNKYYESMDEMLEFQVKIEELIQKWLDGEYNSKDIDGILENAYQKLDILKAKTNEYYREYMSLLEKEHQLAVAKRRIHSQLGVNPDEIIVTGGVLSSNASESHLLGREKTREELLEEKNEAFVGIRQMLADRSISLAQASGLRHEIELVYNSKLQEFSSKQK